MKKGFIKMSEKEMSIHCGGFGWMPFLVALSPFLINAISQTVSTIMTLSSSKGSIKYQGFESHWEKPNHKNHSTKKEVHQSFVYAY